MTDLRKAAEMALEALVDFGWHIENCPQFPTWAEPKKHPPCTCGYDTTITALRQALEQPEQSEATVLPDGSAFGVMSYPLPKTHWIFAEREYADGQHEPIELGNPILTYELRDAVVSAVRYAIRGATNCGKEMDFDPDALVQNAVYALCGPYRKSPSQSDDAAWAKHLKEPMSEKRVYGSDTIERECNPHPDAPHGFNRDASHGLGRYVCDCEGWEPPNVSQEPQTMPEKTDGVAQETQPEQKPVAWLDIDEDEAYSNSEIDEEAKTDLTPLYLAPPKREWVGLTDDEVNDLKHWLDHRAQWSYIEFASAIEAKLKEKNT